MLDTVIMAGSDYGNKALGGAGMIGYALGGWFLYHLVFGKKK